jgi:hypothetical protein
LYWAGKDQTTVYAERHDSNRSDYVDILENGGTPSGILSIVTYASAVFGNPATTKQARELHTHFRRASFQNVYFNLTTDISTSTSPVIPVAANSTYDPLATSENWIGPPVAPKQFRVLVPQAYQRGTYYNWTLIVNEPYAYWALNGISTVFETTSERTGTVR